MALTGMQAELDALSSTWSSLKDPWPIRRAAAAGKVSRVTHAQAGHMPDDSAYHNIMNTCHALGHSRSLRQ